MPRCPRPSWVRLSPACSAAPWGAQGASQPRTFHRESLAQLSSGPRGTAAPWHGDRHPGQPWAGRSAVQLPHSASPRASVSPTDRRVSAPAPPSDCWHFPVLKRSAGSSSMKENQGRPSLENSHCSDFRLIKMLYCFCCCSSSVVSSPQGTVGATNSPGVPGVSCSAPVSSELPVTKQ